ncbi:MAG TPA: winged helix DNA-binding domain-containing protein [Actinomycetota bacterium]|nr:winged helix DNA-binding domain-containing protein [Actinomycetota bacterium]
MLDARALNRALLERQMLLRRHRTPVLRAVERLVAIQAQVPRDPYVALWSRLDGFRPEALAARLADRRAVRMTLLRATLHLVTAPDALALRPLIQPVVERMVYGSSPFRQVAGDADVDELLTFFRQLLEDRPRPRADLVRAAGERWPDRDAESLGYAMYLLPTVQVPPRGLWGKSGPSAFTIVDAWLGPSARASTVDDLVLRYLAVFGPATPADVQAWSGLAAMREILERLRPRLRTFRDERDRELFDVPRAGLPDPDTPAPVRFLPEFDNVLLGHADRTRIVPSGTPQWGDPGWGSVLVDGWFSARWRLERSGGTATLRVDPFRPLSRRDRAAVAAEGDALLVFLAPGTGSRGVRLG